MKALEMTSLYHKKTSHQLKKTSFYRKETSFQGLTPIAQSPFTICKQSLHPYLPQFSPIADTESVVLPTLFPSIGKWLRRYRQTNAFCCFRFGEVRVMSSSSRVKNMSLESLGCLESLVPSKPSKPSEPTLTSNQRLRLHHSSLVLKIGIGNAGNWQHSPSSTNQHSSPQI